MKMELFKSNKILIIGICIVLAVIVIGLTVYLIIENINSKLPKEIVISQFDYSIQEKSKQKINEKKLTDRNDIKKLNNLYKKLTTAENVQTNIQDQIIIAIDDGTKIYIELERQDYCFIQEGNGERRFANLTSEFLDYVKSILEIK